MFIASQIDSLAESLESSPGQRVRAGDIQLFVSDTGGDRPPLVFFHGMGWTHGLWNHQRARYADRWRVIAGDTRGHGQSDKPAAPYSLEGMARDWLAALDALGLPHWCLVGFSQGGRLAQLVASLAPERTSALVIVGSGCRSSAAGREIMARRIDAMRESPRAGAEAAAASVFSPTFMARESAFLESFVAQRAALDIEPLAAVMQAVQPEFDVRESLARLDCPALVIVGDEDRLCSVDAAREVADVLPHAEFHVIAGSGHMVTLERAQQFDALLDDFLTEHYL